MHLNFIDPKIKIFRDFWVFVLSSIPKNETSKITKIFQEFLKLPSDISVFWGFLMNFCDFWVFDFGYRAQNKNLGITENLYFLFFLPKLYQMGFVYIFLYFVVVDNAITLFNCFFRDFRGFHDFWVFTGPFLQAFSRIFMDIQR